MRRDSSEERREQDDAAHDLDESVFAWWCHLCATRVYGTGEHWGLNGLCKASAPMAGGGERHDQETGRTLATGPAAGTSLPAAGPNLSVPPRKDADR